MRSGNKLRMHGTQLRSALNSGADIIEWEKVK
jgi:hypothetical protein